MASFANSSVIKNFEQVKKATEAFAAMAKRFDQMHEQFNSFARSALREVVKARTLALKEVKGDYHAALKKLLPLLETLRSLLKLLLTPTPYRDHAEIRSRPKREPEKQNAPPLASRKWLAKAFADSQSQSGCLTR
jgi:hypothetical protein